MNDRSKIVWLGLCLGLGGCGVDPAPPLATTTAAVSSGCPLQAPGSRIQHIIYIQFDNVHFRRDTPDVPSDLEQMPHLLDFITGHGTMLGNHHTPLISHTGDDLLTAITGVYGDRHGQPVSNSFGVFTPPNFLMFDFFPSSFAYWTTAVNALADPRFGMITPDGKNAPAPWVAFTRAGCNVGGSAMANIELENVSSDLVNVFGAGSPEVAAARADAKQAAADLDGIAIHCAAGDPVCAGGHADVLPDEPGGYVGFNALYGHKVVAPVINPGGPLLGLDGAVITDADGRVGFPGFDLTAAQSLAYVAAMQEHGVPITFALIGDVHDDHVARRARGPGEAGYVAQLAAYDRAWDAFFTRLARDGITEDNTLFVFTADENDHFVGGPASPAGCDGIHTPCTYAQIGALAVNTPGLLHGVDPTIDPAADPGSFNLLPDLSASFFVKGMPAPGAASVRSFERAAAQLTAVNPLTGATERLVAALADPVEMKLLHMVTGDPQRTPSFVMFGQSDWLFLNAPLNGKDTPDIAETPLLAWNHGGIQPDITTTWLGLVGPGVRHRGIDNATFTDHTDIRPTLLVLAGLSDDYRHDGVAIVDELHEAALPRSVRDDGIAFRAVARAYKQITAPLGELGRETLAVSTTALAGDDATYAALSAKLTDLGARRDALAARMIAALDDVEFHRGTIRLGDAIEMIADAARLLVEARRL